MIMNRYAKNKFEHFVFKNFIRTKPMYLIGPWYSPPQSEIRKQGLPESEISLFEIMSHAGEMYLKYAPILHFLRLKWAI